MGLLDIFYNEWNRWRDKVGSEEEKENGVKKALNKALKKFQFTWDDLIMGHAYTNNELISLLKEFSDNFSSLAVEVDETLKDREIVQSLRDLSKQFRQLANSSNLQYELPTLNLGHRAILPMIKALSEKLDN